MNTGYKQTNPGGRMAMTVAPAHLLPRPICRGGPPDRIRRAYVRLCRPMSGEVGLCSEFLLVGSQSRQGIAGVRGVVGRAKNDRGSQSRHSLVSRLRRSVFFLHAIHALTRAAIACRVFDANHIQRLCLSRGQAANFSGSARLIGRSPSENGPRAPASPRLAAHRTAEPRPRICLKYPDGDAREMRVSQYSAILSRRQIVKTDAIRQYRLR